MSSWGHVGSSGRSASCIVALPFLALVSLFGLGMQLVQVVAERSQAQTAANWVVHVALLGLAACFAWFAVFRCARVKVIVRTGGDRVIAGFLLATVGVLAGVWLTLRWFAG